MASEHIKQLLAMLQEMGPGSVFEVESDEILVELLRANNDQLATELTRRLPSGSIRVERQTTAEGTVAFVHLEGAPIPFITDEDGLGTFLIGFASGLSFAGRTRAGAD